MKNNGNDGRRNQIIMVGIVIAAALLVLSVTRMPESGGTTEDYTQDILSAGVVESTLEVSDAGSGALPEYSGEGSPSDASDESTDNPSDAPDESTDGPTDVLDESTDSISDASDESIDNSTEASAEGLGSAEESQESVPDVVETILESSQAAEWADVPQQTYSFRNERLLNQHYEKHGIEMGFATIEEYVAAANAVISHPDALHKQEEEDNDDIYFLESTNEFVVVSTDGFIRTYFIASGGIDYYNRQ